MNALRRNSIRIAHVSSAHPWNDVRIFIKEARSLAKAGYDVTIIAQGANDAVVDGVRCLSIQVPSGRLERMLLGPWRVLTKARHYDIIHFHDPELMPVGLLLKLLGKRVIYDVHEDVPRQIKDKYWIPAFLRSATGNVMEAAEWLVAQFVDKIVAATPTIAERFPAGKTLTLCNYPLLGELSYEGQQSYDKRPNVFVYVGWLSPSRGLSEIVKAIDCLQDRPDVRVVLVGGASPKSFLAKLQAEPGWTKTDYIGPQDRAGVARVLAAARAGLVVLHPTPNYLVSLPVKLFEYMMAGLPIIASDFLLWRRILDEDRVGILVNPNDPSDIARAMRWILDNPEEAAAMGKRGQQAVIEKYNWSTEERKLLVMYDSLQ